MRQAVQRCSRGGRCPALVAIALVLVNGGISLGQAGQAVTVSPSSGAAFTVVTVAGSGCTGSDPRVSGTLVGPPEIGSPPGSFFQVLPSPSGDWTGTFTVPPFVPPGQYEVATICSDNPSDPSGHAYLPHPFTVLEPGVPPTLTVSPQRATAGTNVTLDVAGTLCRGPEPMVDVRVLLRVPEEFAGQADAARAVLTPDAGGDWAGQVTIPASAPAGTYGVGVQCSIRGGLQFFIYQPTPNVTLVPAAVPAPPVQLVPRRVELTG